MARCGLVLLLFTCELVMFCSSFSAILSKSPWSSGSACSLRASSALDLVGARRGGASSSMPRQAKGRISAPLRMAGGSGKCGKKLYTWEEARKYAQSFGWATKSAPSLPPSLPPSPLVPVLLQLLFHSGTWTLLFPQNSSPTICIARNSIDPTHVQSSGDNVQMCPCKHACIHACTCFLDTFPVSEF